jgi:hypothetical protein
MGPPSSRGPLDHCSKGLTGLGETEQEQSVVVTNGGNGRLWGLSADQPVTFCVYRSPFIKRWYGESTLSRQAQSPILPAISSTVVLAFQVCRIDHFQASHTTMAMH